MIVPQYAYDGDIFIRKCFFTLQAYGVMHYSHIFTSQFASGARYDVHATVQAAHIFTC